MHRYRHHAVVVVKKVLTGVRLVVVVVPLMLIAIVVLEVRIANHGVRWQLNGALEARHRDEAARAHQRRGIAEGGQHGGGA